ncbi:MAG: NADH-quinone oxidoreductase subunit J [Rickettsiales bacterium]|nr:NADH-quinone oxidoreductase subunit J [Rickettsiales bacterium]
MNLIAFYIFSFLLISSSLFVITARNPVHSVLFLIFAFFNSAGLFLLQGAEFLALILVIIYVGAVAILFLFVVMMLNIEIKSIKKELLKILPFTLIISSIIFAEIYFATTISLNSLSENIKASYPTKEGEADIYSLGKILYTEFFFHFQIAGLILLVAMMGAVILTLRQRENVKKQKISEQVLRSRKDSVKLVKVLTGKGV